MPVKIGTFGPMSEAEFTELQRQKARKANPELTALLDELAAGQPVRVPLFEGQRARGLRVAISRAARSRGMSVETLEGDGFVAVRKAEPPSVRTSAAASEQGKRRGRPPKQ